MDSCFTLPGANQHGIAVGSINGGEYAMLMSLNKGETAVHGYHYPGDMAARMREVLARPWVGVCVPLELSLSCDNTLKNSFFQFLFYSHAYLRTISRACFSRARV